MSSQLDRAHLLQEASRQRTYAFWGPGGSGKSTAMCLHPGKGFVIDSNRKLHEMRNLDDATRKRITIWQPEAALAGEEIDVATINPKKPDEGADGMWKVQPKGYEEIMQVTNDLLRLAYKCRTEGTPFPYDWVGHDSLTHTLMHLEQAVMARHHKTVIPLALYKVVKRDILRYLEGWHRISTVAKIDTILIAHSMPIYERDEEGAHKLLKYEPIVTGALRETLFTDFTEVYFFRGGSSDGKWRVQTFNDSRAEARTSSKLERIQVVDAKAFYD